MKILRGKDKGKEFKLNQFCNDWVTASNGKVYLITNVEFIVDEIQRIMEEDTNMMFKEFELRKNRFYRKR